MIWRPFTQEKTAPTAIKIIRGEGAYLFSENGEKYLDMMGLPTKNRSI
jgi:adenosylmethionine-8-amino-7-oxononanoate aminotransferase